MSFGGTTYDADLDFERLKTQLEKVRWLLTHPKGEWWTLSKLKARVGAGSEASISARIRDLRKKEFGGYRVEHRRRGVGGLWEYRVMHLPHEVPLWTTSVAD